MSWSHEEIKRKEHRGSWFVLVKFTRHTGEEAYTRFRFDSEAQITAEGLARVNAKKTKLELKWSPLNDFDLGPDIDGRRIMKEMIIAIRQSPNATLAQFETWYDNNFPDAPWKAFHFIDKTREWLTKAFGVKPSWNQFKTYVINNVFAGVDG